MERRNGKELRNFTNILRHPLQRFLFRKVLQVEHSFEI
jgi:hypothetical protein